jgi:hypothetical protein
MNFDGRNEVRVQMTVTEKWADQKRIKANLQNQDGRYPHNINVTDHPLMAVLEIDKTYEVTIQRGNGKLDENKKPINTNVSFGYFWNLIEIHQEQAPVEEGHMVRAAVAMGARVINETENKQAPKPFSEWREAAAERTQQSIERQQLIVFANNILTAHDEIQIKLGNTDNVSTTVNDRLIRIKAIARSLEPHFATGFQEQVLTEEVGGIPKEELFPPQDEPPIRSDDTPFDLEAYTLEKKKEYMSSQDQASTFDLNDPDQRV